MPGVQRPLHRRAQGPGPWVLVLLLGFACGTREHDVSTLEVVQITPEPGAEGVFLNERVQVLFSRALDPASVHSSSARLLGPDGKPASGRWEVRGRRLSFTPRPVLERDLSDGGLRPGGLHRLELVGFPRPDGLRDERGAPLAATVRSEFRVVAAENPRPGSLFEDASLDGARPLLLRNSQVEAGGAILLEGEEPIDPSSIRDRDFLLTEVPPPGPRASGAGPIPLRARLVENHDRYAADPVGTTLLELIPRERTRIGTRYQLELASDATLCDFGGHPVAMLDAATGRRRPLLTVLEPSVGASSSAFEPFLGAQNRSLEVVEGADGTAWWGRSGRVEVRFPAAAGNGSEGAVVLAGQDDAREHHGVRLQVPAGELARLSSEPGTVVLRAQGSLRVEGRLERDVPGGPLDFSSSRTVSGWIEGARSAGVTATVLVAGGDLVVTGSIVVEGPLVLVAGGRVRVTGMERIEAPAVYVWGEGDWHFLNSRKGTVDLAGGMPLQLDPPTVNPLVEALTFAVRSGPIPRQGRARRWHPSPRVGGYPEGLELAGAGGSYRVRYVGERNTRGLGEAAEVVVDDPVQLVDCPSLRLLIELEVRPGEVWDPPWLDFVELSWDRAEEGAFR